MGVLQPAKNKQKNIFTLYVLTQGKCFSSPGKKERKTFKSTVTYTLLVTVIYFIK